MTYQCQDCSYKGNKFNSGACPACGSNNVRRLKAETKDDDQKEKKPYRLIFAIGLWCFLAVEIYKKLS